MKMKPTFAEWMKAVDTAIVEKTGISALDLPDVCYHDWYDDGLSPRRAAAMAVRSAMADMGY